MTPMLISGWPNFADSRDNDVAVHGQLQPPPRQSH
jgi:hypothetical protein